MERQQQQQQQQHDSQLNVNSSSPSDDDMHYLCNKDLPDIADIEYESVLKGIMDIQDDGLGQDSASVHYQESFDNSHFERDTLQAEAMWLENAIRERINVSIGSLLHVIL